MITVPAWAILLFLGYVTFTLVMALARGLQSWRKNVHRKKEEAFLKRANSILAENAILKDRILTLEENNQHLQEEHCRLITYSIKLGNELRSNDGAKTQVFTLHGPEVDPASQP
jgi:hypothetical protein